MPKTAMLKYRRNRLRMSRFSRLEGGAHGVVKGCVGGGDRHPWGWSFGAFGVVGETRQGGWQELAGWWQGAQGVVSGSLRGAGPMLSGWRKDATGVPRRCLNGGARMPGGSTKPPPGLLDDTPKSAARVPRGTASSCPGWQVPAVLAWQQASVWCAPNAPRRAENPWSPPFTGTYPSTGQVEAVRLSSCRPCQADCQRAVNFILRCPRQFPMNLSTGLQAQLSHVV